MEDGSKSKSSTKKKASSSKKSGGLTSSSGSSNNANNITVSAPTPSTQPSAATAAQILAAQVATRAALVQSAPPELPLLTTAQSCASLPMKPRPKPPMSARTHKPTTKTSSKLDNSADGGGPALSRSVSATATSTPSNIVKSPRASDSLPSNVVPVSPSSGSGNGGELRSWFRKYKDAQEGGDASPSSSSSSSSTGAGAGATYTSSTALIRGGTAELIEQARERSRKEQDEAIQLQKQLHVPMTVSADEPLNSRALVIAEIINTEADYLRDLDIIFRLYYHPLQADPKGLSKKSIRSLFSNIELLRGLNQRFFDALLEQRDLPPEDQRIGQCFNLVAQFLKMYSEYCSNQQVSSKEIRSQLEHNKEFALFCRYTQSKPECRSLDLESFLIKPTQRVCKYPLLLRELLKATPLDHPDHAEVASAAAMIEASVNAINETKRDIENAAKLNELQQKYGLTLLEGGRYHVYEGHLGLLVKRKIKKTYVYLLSDTLLITTSKELIETLSLKNALVNDTAEHANGFEVVEVAKKKVVLVADSPNEKALWMEKIEAIIAKFFEKYFQTKAVASSAHIERKHDDKPLNYVTFSCTFQEQTKVIQLEREELTYMVFLNAVARAFQIVETNRLSVGYVNAETNRVVPVASLNDFNAFLPFMANVSVWLA